MKVEKDKINVELPFLQGERVSGHSYTTQNCIYFKNFPEEQ